MCDVCMCLTVFIQAILVDKGLAAALGPELCGKLTKLSDDEIQKLECKPKQFAPVMQQVFDYFLFVKMARRCISLADCALLCLQVAQKLLEETKQTGRETLAAGWALPVELCVLKFAVTSDDYEAFFTALDLATIDAGVAASKAVIKEEVRCLRCTHTHHTHTDTHTHTYARGIRVAEGGYSARSQTGIRRRH